MEEYFIKTYGGQICGAARGRWTKGDPDPTFQEFVKYLIQTKIEKYDEHWQPISLRCRYAMLCTSALLETVHGPL